MRLQANAWVDTIVNLEAVLILLHLLTKEEFAQKDTTAHQVLDSLGLALQENTVTK